jgi:plastocyanin
MSVARRAVLAALFVVGSAVGAAAGAETVEVAVENRKFVPAEIKVKVGDTVKWINREKRDNHSVWFKDAGIEESDRFFPGESWQYTFDKPGRYPYVCGPHPEMTGVVEVTL